MRIAAAALVGCGLLLAGCTYMPYEQDVRALTGGDPHRGRELVRGYGCDSCHTIPGIQTADAHVGPPLVNVARRVYLAGRIQNTPANMMLWIQHPRSFDEKTAMPEMGVTEQDSKDITAYLYTLR